MPFVKLDCAILFSSLWPDKDARDLFITALLMAEPFELTTMAQQLETAELEPTGWVVPPGWYGFVKASGIGIAHQAGVPKERALPALRRLASPEGESKSAAYGGRRMVRIDGGFIILNYMVFRERDYSAGERMRRYRARKRSPETSLDADEALRLFATQCNAVTDNATDTRNVTQAEAEADKDKARAPLRRFTDHVKAKWQSRYGMEYPFKKLDGIKAADILAACRADDAKACGVYDRYIACNDPFYKGHPLAVLASSAVLPRFIVNGNGQQPLCREGPLYPR